ncbi:MAG: hypothetical protein KKC05_03920, partial [Nanoarchaeota archaeon]|nr:hypothetical protein [Nanoarchaeota archaeon]
FAEGSVLEYPDAARRGINFKTDYSIALGYTKFLISNKIQLPNVATFWIPEYVSASDGHIQEGAIQDTRTAGLYKLFFDISKKLTNDKKIEVKFAGWSKSGSVERDQIFTLATYHLGKTENTYYLYAGSYTDPYKQWFDAIEYQIGDPLGDFYLFEKGADPSGTSSGKEYEIYAREFENALILVKFVPWWTSSLGSDSLTKHDLPDNFSILKYDGTLESKTDSILLRNGEAAILIK